MEKNSQVFNLANKDIYGILRLQNFEDFIEILKILYQKKYINILQVENIVKST